MQGNEACAKGAIYAGCRFFAGYPITPSTEIIELLSSEMVKLDDGVFIQMEDEIGSACAIIGARWGGKKSMTATSGPGFTLMMEAIGYAVSTETPTVIVNIQRGGPSTGQPTMSSQQDIYQARYGSHGDYEIIALAPSSVQEMYDFTIKAFELSERFRTPVILLADEVVGHMREKICIHPGTLEEILKIEFGHRPDVLSPQGDFFTGKNLFVEGQLHDETGNRVGHIPSKSSDFIHAIRTKIANHVEEIQNLQSFHMEDADMAIIAYGSVVRPGITAMDMARKEKDMKLGVLKVNTVWPFPEKAILRAAQKCRTVFVPEMNMGKYCREIERCLKKTKVISLPKNGGEIHNPKEILQAIYKEAGYE